MRVVGSLYESLESGTVRHRCKMMLLMLSFLTDLQQFFTFSKYLKPDRPARLRMPATYFLNVAVSVCSSHRSGTDRWV